MEEFKKQPQEKFKREEAPVPQAKKEALPPKEKIDLNNFSQLRKLIRDYKESPKALTPLISKHINDIIEKSELKEKYNILFIYDEINNISTTTLNRLYRSLSKIDNRKDLLLILHSRGGEVEPAYIISKCCGEAPGRFITVIPRKAKSSATLIALGADEIHMGNISELGPIDPQIGKMSALTVMDALKHISRLIKKYPEASDMFAKFLINKLEDLQILGYFTRIPEAARDYALRLLLKKGVQENEAKSISKEFVYKYKHHGFVIDKDEAKSLLGEIIKTSTEEYNLAEKIHKFLELFHIALFSVLGSSHYITLVGDIKTDLQIWKKS